ncbi:hypothetical protein [Nocardia huaxiensis]|uniref:Fe2OG dioxygenase domain-containing protein n=1 Tax=Nocardia huaxiensis TaxID=2755382 RepID=A0A7D6VAR0_9NOCA|nr:hypothetical protein [Nocardia huaxiensis]QLY28337.1 hypothetical protein H0264_23490 [Nocardia huaxiensis]UFS98221.1 hypothetical protein LPY97_10155 [Nocardia huaxiensis]
MRISLAYNQTPTAGAAVRAALRDRFAIEGYAPLPELFDAASLAGLDSELTRLELACTRRDFRMACMDGSPRHMTTLGGQAIATGSALIPRLYDDPSLRELLCAITGLELIAVPDPLERHVLNILHRPGDTHGAHIDDYPIALVVFLEAPPGPPDGGLLEYLSDSTDLRRFAMGQTRFAYHRRGDAYLLRSDTTAHRVTPLRRSGIRRVALNFAYTTEEFTPVRTSSAARLYGR